MLILCPSHGNMSQTRTLFHLPTFHGHFKFREFSSCVATLLIIAVQVLLVPALPNEAGTVLLHVVVNK